ncbi:MAG: DUF1156 domain-containing protein [Candidatus Methanomethylicaceae archaeon]
MNEQIKLFDDFTSLRIPSKTFIESYKFPWSEVSEASAVEKGPGRPPHWEMVFWWTRKPLISARAIIAGCLLPEGTSPRAFLRGIGIGGRSKAAHNNPPLYRFSGIRLLDPFAGFGSIPLEAMRLGLEATAVELLPTAYVFLKAVLEYPAKYGKRLVEDVERWGKWVTERLREDPLIKQLYDDDVAVYIGSWEIKCPNCERWTPLVGNWWLARVKGGKGYERLAWMEPFVEGDEVKIRVVDLNRELRNNAIKDAKVSGLRVLIIDKEFRVPESNIEARRERAICLLCHQPIMQVDPQTGRHYTETKNLPKEVRERLEGYVKYAIKTYNQSLEQDGVTPLARQRLLVKVKVKGGDLEFEPCMEKDQEKLEFVRREMKKMLQESDPDIPVELTEPYCSSTYHTIVWGFDKFYKLFNPRQLLTLTKLVKLIREAGKKIEEEKQKEGQTKEEAQLYAEAITSYLATSQLKFSDYNTLVNLWNPGSWSWNKVAHSLSMRGIAMQWNWCEINPTIDLPLSYNGTISNAIRATSYLTSGLHANLGNAYALLDDATAFNKIQSEYKPNLIVTDPPYYDDVPYAELSDFYYVWLKRALSDVKDGRLVPRFLPEAFFERVGDGWVEVSTQWEKYALNEVSLNPPRLGADAKYEDGVKHFQNLLNASFTTMASKLMDDGLLVTYYAHTDPDAWKALLKAGWEAAGLRVTNAFPITTESAQSIVKRGKLSMDTSIVVVWRKGASGSIEASKLYEEMVEEAAERAMRLIELGVTGRDLFINTLAAALAAATSYREVISLGKLSVDELVDKYVYPAASIGLAKAFARRAEIKDGVRSPDAMFYILAKCLIAGARKKIIESTDLRLLSIGTSLDVKVALKEWKLLREMKREEEAGAKVAKAKTLILLEPPSAEKAKIAELLEAKGVGTSEEPNVRCTVDALHILEYYAITYSATEYVRRLEKLREKYPAQVNEALSLAKIFARVLPEDDPEKRLCERVILPAFQLGGT